MKLSLLTKKTTEKLLPFVFLFLISLPAILPLTKPGLFTSHDAEGHVVRLSEFHDALMDSQFPVRWAKRLDNGAGYPFFDFNYPLPYYLAEIPHLLGANLVDSIKITFLWTYITSGFAMYLFLTNVIARSECNERRGNLPQGCISSQGGVAITLLGGILYLYAPYRFIDMYVRGALAEHLSFVFLPLIFLSIDKAIEKASARNLILGGLSFGALILSHNIMAMIFLPTSILYLLQKSKLDSKKIKAGIIPILFGIVLSAYFWLPMIADKRYTNLDFFMQKEYKTNFLNVQNLIYSNWGFGAFRENGSQGSMSLQLGIAQWFSLFISMSLVTYSVKNKKVTKDFMFFLILIITPLFLTTNLAKPLWDALPFIRLVQFPWRLMGIAIFAIPVLLTISLTSAKLSNVQKGLLTITLVLLALYSNRNHARANAYFNWRDWWQDTRGYNGTTTMANEHRPIWLRDAPALPYVSGAIVGGNGTFKETAWRSNYHEFTVNTTSAISFKDRTAYFPGWQVYVDAREASIDYKSVESGGFLTISIPEGEHKVVSKFTETPIRLFADIISLISMSFITIWFFSKAFFVKKN